MIAYRHFGLKIEGQWRFIFSCWLLLALTNKVKFIYRQLSPSNQQKFDQAPLWDMASHAPRQLSGLLLSSQPHLWTVSSDFFQDGNRNRLLLQIKGHSFTPRRNWSLLHNFSLSGWQASSTSKMTYVSLINCDWIKMFNIKYAWHPFKAVK